MGKTGRKNKTYSTEFYNNERISLKLKGMSPVNSELILKYLIHFCLNFGIHFIFMLA